MVDLATPGPGNRTLRRLGYAPLASPSNSSTKRDELLYQYFTSGAVDFTACEGDTTVALTDNDFANMETEIECAFPVADMTA